MSTQPRKKEGRRQLAESEPNRQSRRVAHLGVEPHRSLEDVERDARKANAERRKAAKEAKEVLAQEGVPSGSAVQDVHQVSKSGGEETAPDEAGVSMSADSKLGPDDEDKSVPDASAQASVGGPNVVEPPVGGRVSDSPQPEHEVEASDDDEVEYVETKKPQFGQLTTWNSWKLVQIRTPTMTNIYPDAGPSSIATVASAEVQVKVFVADQVRRWERDVSERSFPPNIKYDWPHDHLDSSSYLSAVLTTSEYLRKRTSMAAEADAWVAEMELTRRTFGDPGDWTAVTISVAHFSPRECVAVLQTQLFEAGFGFLNLVPGWFRTRANQAHPDSVRNVVEAMLILLTIEMVELRQLLVRAAEIQVSARAEQPRPEGNVLEPDVGMSDHEVELLGRDYVRMLKVSGLQKPRCPRGPSVREPGPKRIERVPALAPPSSIPTPESPQSVAWSAFRSLEGARPGSMSSGPESSVKSESQATSSLFGTTGGSDEALASATSGSRTSRDSSSGSSGFSWGRDAGGHMSAAPMAMTTRTFGGDTAVGPAIAIRRSKRSSPSPSAAKRVTDAAAPVNAPRPGRSRASASSGSTQVALNAMYQVQEAVARMETRQDSALEKLNARLDLEVARRFGPRAQGASEKLEHAPTQTDNARVHHETETQEAARLEAVRLERERADALLAQYRAQTEAHQAEEARRVTTMVKSMQQELEHMRVERARERETAKNVQTFLREQLRNIRTTSVQTTPRSVTSQPDLTTSRAILYPESSGVINDDRKAATEGETRRGAQPDAAKRARPANAKSAERKGRDASSQNNKSKRTPKYRGSSDNSDSDSSSGSSDQDSNHSDSSSFEDVVPNIPTVTGPGGTMFTFRPYVNASALEDFDEKASLAVRTRWLERFQSITVQGG
ncbi:unnamed protein product [Phytophthora fragariaefolia]|uniref:Unnamed protein product n=1 Tax=Phytophthora fragariaefolia TaxID=1490495 RepID=A0A9W7CWB8_9STRA|nr:unnamed protein product [Phytophthora fragariaefolia]